MQTKQLGNSDLFLTPMGIGAWAIGGGGWAFGWGPQDDNESVAGIRAAVDAGMNWIDTAAVYGLGHSEDVVARALDGMTKRPYVFTKCERTWNSERQIVKCLKADSIKRECEDSLRRLKLDVIDLYQIHWPEPDEDIEEGWTAMADLQRQGKVRWIGVSNFNVAQMKRAQAIAPITSLQPSYSMLVRSIEEEILPYAGANKIGVISYSPMRNGLLMGSMTRDRIASSRTTGGPCQTHDSPPDFFLAIPHKITKCASRRAEVVLNQELVGALGKSQADTQSHLQLFQPGMWVRDHTNAGKR